MGTTKATAPKKSAGFTGIKSAGLVILACMAIATAIYLFVYGSADNFQGGAEVMQAPFAFLSSLPELPHPADGNLLGTIYMGGFVVPIIQGLLLTVIALSIERYFAIRTAYGKYSLTKFVAEVKACLAKGDIAGAQAVCDKQRGSVANVVGATLIKYKEVEADNSLTKEQKILAIQKELEEATALEMPMMQENLPIIGTITTLGTLLGLLGTVMGMIKSFAALAAGGGADSTQLSIGISEALVNTASGIATGTFAVISYNYFTNKIDKLTFSLDEVGFSIVQTFSATH